MRCSVFLRPESVEAHYERVQVYMLIYGLLDMGVTEVLSLCAKKIQISATLWELRRFMPPSALNRCIIWLYTEIFKIKVDHTFGPFLS